MRSQAPWRHSPLVALRARESGTPNRSGVGSLGLTSPARQLRPSVIWPARRSTRERSPHASSPSGQSRCVGDDRQGRNSQRQRHHVRVPPQESPSNRAAGAWRVVVTTSRHVPHSAAPLARRPTVRAIVDREAARRQARRHDARPHGPHRPRGDGRSVSERAASLELIQQQQVIVAGQRGVIMRGRRGSRYWPPARRRARTSGVARRTRRRPHVGGQADESMLALVRLLARQAAREAFIRPSRSRIVPSKRTANESRHLRPVLV